MDTAEYLRLTGYQKGLEDALKTGGKITQENIDRYLNAEARKLSSDHSKEFIEGWYQGFNDGVGEVISKLATRDDFWNDNIIWENPVYKSR